MCARVEKRSTTNTRGEGTTWSERGARRSYLIARRTEHTTPRHAPPVRTDDAPVDPRPNDRPPRGVPARRVPLSLTRRRRRRRSLSPARGDDDGRARSLALARRRRWSRSRARTRSLARCSARLARSRTRSPTSGSGSLTMRRGAAHPPTHPPPVPPPVAMARRAHQDPSSPLATAHSTGRHHAPPSSFVPRGRREARHFLAWHGRLGALGTAFGDLPCHDGLWADAEVRAAPRLDPASLLLRFSLASLLLLPCFSPASLLLLSPTPLCCGVSQQ